MTSLSVREIKSATSGPVKPDAVSLAIGHLWDVPLKFEAVLPRY